MTTAERPERSYQEDISRIVLLAWAVLCWKWACRLWEGGDLALNDVGFWLGIMGPMLGFVLLVRALSSRALDRTHHFALASAAYASICVILIDLRARDEQGLFFTTDGHVFLDYAARLLRRGVNPYTQDMFDSFRANRSPLMFNTPLINGDMTGRVAYPALSFLALIPFQWAHLPPRFVYPIFQFACFALLLWRAKPVLRPLVLLPFFIDDAFLNYAFGGVTDSVWALLLMGVVIVWPRSLALAGVLLGLACSYKHQPWLVAPFLAVRAFHEAEGTLKDKGQNVLRLVFWAAVPFVVLNLPFVVWDPQAWWTGSVEPMRAQMVAYGQGLSALTMTGRVQIGKGAYGAMFAATFGLLLWIYHRHFKALRELAWIAPSIALWFNNRGLSSYWYLNALPLAMALADRGAIFPVVSRESLARVRTTALATAALIVSCSVAITAFALRPAPFALRAGPFQVSWENVYHMRVHVHNRQEEPLRPQFYVESHLHQPTLWPIVSGPREVPPGDMASFDIRAPWPAAEPNLVRGGIVTVSAHGSYDVRASVRFGPSVDSRYPDAIPNGSFRYWEGGHRRPQFWNLMEQGAPGARVVLVDKHASDTWSEVELQVPKGRAAQTRTVELDTYILLPERPVELFTFVPESANRLPDPDLIYGMRVYVRGALHLILFGDHEGVGTLADGTPFFGIRSERERWTRHVLDLRPILTSLGADLRPQRLRMPRFEMLDMPMVPVGVRLSVITDQPREVRVRFGRIRSLGLRPDLDEMVAQSLAHPEEIALWHALYRIDQGLGNETLDEAVEAAVNDPSGFNLWLVAEIAFYQKRYDVALSAYSAAQRANHEPWITGLGVGNTLMRLERYQAAFDAFQRLVDRLHDNPAEVVPRAQVAEAFGGIAIALAELGDCEGALEAFDKQQAYVEGAPFASSSSFELCQKARRGTLQLFEPAADTDIEANAAE